MGSEKKLGKLSSEIGERNGNRELNGRREVIEPRLRRVRCRKPNRGYSPEQDVRFKTTPTSRKGKRNDSGKGEKGIISNGTGKSVITKNKERILTRATETDGNYLEDVRNKEGSGRRRVKKQFAGESETEKNSRLSQRSMNSSVSRHLKAPVRQAKTQTQRKSKILQVKYPEDYRFRCSKCSYSGTNLSYLNQHLRTHSSEKPYRCEYCPAMFRFLGGLNQHRRTHTGERPFLCKFCNFAGTQWCSLNVHMNGHNVKKQFKCSFCPYWSSVNRKISDHEIKYHTNQVGVSSVTDFRRISQINKTKVSNIKTASRKFIPQILNNTRDLVQRNHQIQYVKSELFNFKEFKFDMEFVENNFCKCDIKLRVLPDVLISGVANLRGVEVFKTDVQPTTNDINSMNGMC